VTGASPSRLLGRRHEKYPSESLVPIRLTDVKEHELQRVCVCTNRLAIQNDYANQRSIGEETKKPAATVEAGFQQGSGSLGRSVGPADDAMPFRIQD
jgi:hypothetical protein